MSIETSATSIVSIALALKAPRLVTTDIASEPDYDLEDTFFLGRWCFKVLHLEQEAFKANRILPFHWDDRIKLSADYFRLGALNQQLLEELVPVLNHLHNVSESNRYWKILLGYWLNIYTTVIFDRWSSSAGSIFFSEMAHFYTLFTIKILHPITPVTLYISRQSHPLGTTSFMQVFALIFLGYFVYLLVKT